MYWRAVYTMLATLAALAITGEARTCGGCDCVAFQPLPKTLVCDTNCSDNFTVVWNLYVEEPSTINVTFRYNLPHEFHTSTSVQFSRVKVLEDGRLEIEKIDVHAHEGTYTCWAVDSNGTQCGRRDEFELEVFPLFFDLTVRPTLIGRSQDAIYGSQKVVCVNGDSPGIRTMGTFWEKAGVATEQVTDVSLECPDCSDCSSSMIARYLSLPTVVNRTMNYTHSSFVITSISAEVNGRDVSDCVSIPNLYVSLLVINEVMEEDVGNWDIHVVSAYGSPSMTDLTLTATYRKFQTTIEDLEKLDLLEEENGYVICNATHSINLDAELHWDIITAGKSILRLPDATVIGNANRLSESDISISSGELSGLCSDYGHLLREEHVGFSLNYAPDETLSYNSEAHDNALVQRRYLVLVLCDVNRVQAGAYSCIAPASDAYETDREEKGMEVSVEELGGSPGGSSGSGRNINNGAIAGVVVCALIIIVIMVILIVWGARRYRLLKYEAMQMRPMSIPLAATQLTTAINNAFLSFSPIGSPMYDKFEFSRENLVFLEVIGEGQFGQVWRARAMGICNEDSRNIVAVKTLKENYRDSDYFDLRSELDIMRSMEPHPNIINLLGVCSEIGSNPLCILMEYAAYGSMKDYLAYCRRVMQAHAEGLTSPTLQEAYPSAAASNGAILHQSMLMGDYPQLQPLAQWEGNEYNYDPMVASRTRRLLQMLKHEGYRPEVSANDESYNHLAPHAAAAAGSDAEAAGVSLYDMLYPHSQCVYRPCLEAYNYACYRGAQWRGNAEQEYYNAGDGTEASNNPSPPIISSPDSPPTKDTAQLIEAPSPPNPQWTGDTVEAPPPLSPRGTKDTTHLIKTPPPQDEAPPPLSPRGTKDTAHLIETPPLSEAPPPLSPRGMKDHIEMSPAPQVKVTDGDSTPVREKTKLGAVLSTPLLSSQEKSTENITSLTASQDNVFECPENLGSSNLLAPSKEHIRESMISFPDGYIYAPASTHGGLSVSEMEVGVGVAGEEGEVQRKEKEPAPLMEDMINHMDLLDFALQIARGMDHLHRMQCVHRDLAARNILISEDFTLKIGDFGLARDLSDKDYYRKVTPGRLPARWMAPESLEERTHTFQSDVWSYAVVLWEIVSYGEVPYRGQPEANDCDHLAYYLRCGNRLAPPPNTGDEFRDLMSSCWAQNPDKRPTFSEIMSILDNQLSAAHGYLMMASGVDRASTHDPGSTNPSPRMQKRKAMLQKLDKLHGTDRPASLQPGAFSKSKLAKSPSLPVAEPLSTTLPSHPPPPPMCTDTVSPYLLPTPTLKFAGDSGTLLSTPRQGAKFGSNPELSLSGKETGGGAMQHGGGQQGQNGSVKTNGVPTTRSIETQL